MVQRGVEGGLLVGAAVGAGYGVVVPLLMMLPSLIQPRHLDAFISATVISCYAVLLGLVVGGTIGGLAGVIFGILNGGAIGLLTVTLYVPIRDLSEYCWSVRLMSVLVTIGCSFVVMFVLMRISGEEIDLVFVGIPLLLTLPCAWLVSSRLARWYLARPDEAVSPSCG
jgi:MFS family permease